MFFRLVRGLEAQGKVRPGLTFHGLRHTADPHDAVVTAEAAIALLRYPCQLARLAAPPDWGCARRRPIRLSSAS